MRVAGALTLVASIMAAVVFCLLPATVSVLGFSGSCGPPAVRVLDKVLSETPYDELEQECFEQSVVRVVIAGALFAVGGVGGALMLALGGPGRSTRH